MSGVVAVFFGWPSETNAAEGAVDNALWKNEIGELNRDSLLGVSSGEMEKCCVKQRKGMSLETQTTGRELEKIDLANTTCEHFWNLGRTEAS